LNESLRTNDDIQKAVDKYADMLIRIAFLNLKNMSDAEDLAQDVFLKLIEHSPNFESEEHEKAWLIRITINLCKDRLKSAWFRKSVPLDDSLCFMAPEKSETLLSIMELPVKYRNVIMLFYYENYPIKEIAEITGMKDVTIGSQLQRARKMLKAGLNGGVNGE
jgi:RNA polymerase sigma-70 factor (ECF subfamily)